MKRSPATTYWLGLDQGYSKTAMAVADSDGRLLQEAVVATKFTAKPVNPQVAQAERMAKVVSRIRLPEGSRVRIIAATNEPQDVKKIRKLLNAKGLQMAFFEQASDSLGHFGLSSMKPRTLAFCTGSYYIASYFGERGDMHLLKWPYPTAVTWGSWLCAYRYGLTLLDVYARHQLQGKTSSITRAVEDALGPRQGSVYQYLYEHKVTGPQGRIMQLAPLMNDLIRHPDIRGVVREQTGLLVDFLNLAADDSGDRKPACLVLSGAPIVRQPQILKWLKAGWKKSPIEVVEGGNPAYGAIRYRGRFPEARIIHHAMLDGRCSRS